MIIISSFMYFAYAGWAVDGINIFVPALVAKNGWDTGQMLALVTPGGLFGVVGSAVFGQMVIRSGPRFVMTLCLVCEAAVVAWFGQIRTLPEFTIAFILINFFGAGFGYIAPGALLTHWFPRRRGMALAIATCGFPLATALFVPIIAGMFGAVGIPIASGIWGGVFLCAALVCWLLIRDTPEEMGKLPDNGLTAADPDLDMRGYRSPFTLGRLLKDPRMWLISIGWGSLWLVVIGMVSQLVPRLQEFGYAQANAIVFLSAAALCALPGSLLWGWLDQKIGTQRASAVYGLSNLIALGLLIVPQRNTALDFVTLLFVGLGLAGIKSLITSMVATVYGRYDFTSAYRIVIPISIIVRTMSFPIMGWAVSSFGGLTAAYLVFVGIDIVALVIVGMVRGAKGAPGVAAAATAG